MKRAAFALVLLACSTRSPWTPVDPTPRPPRADAGAQIRVSLAAPEARLSATEDFAWYAGDEGAPLARALDGESWRVEQSAESLVRAVGPNQAATAWQRQLVLRTSRAAFVTVNGKRFRGELVVSASPADPLRPLVVNRVPLEDYLRGVVAVEMGNRPRGDSSALQAQAIASRSYALVRLGSRAEFDVRATVADQAYGGVEVENQQANAAVDATRGLVLRYQGRVVDALYSSTCGGSTAEPGEVWRSAGVAYLQRVSDRIAGTDRYYCDVAPRFRWNRTMSKVQLDAALEAYLRAYAQVPAAGPGSARHVAIVGNTPSGRVSSVEVETDRGSFPLKGDEIRYVLRVPGSEILHSTYFSVEPDYGRDGVLARVTFRGRGNGHGVGMCQWGAIGRARAGQSFRTILATYYPGTTVGLQSVQ